jgi:hypothetical protein
VGSSSMSSPSPPAVPAASSMVSSTSPGAPPAAPWVSGATTSTGTTAGYHSPRLQHLSTRGQLHQPYLATTTTLRGYLHLREYSPSTMLASGNAVSAAGASDSA